jgi:hypothetical protein
MAKFLGIYCPDVSREVIMESDIISLLKMAGIMVLCPIILALVGWIMLII